MVDIIHVATTESNVHEIEHVQPKQRHSLRKRILGVVWDSLDDKSPEEHHLVRRLDTCFLIWSCFYYFVMYLDNSRF
jgi:MFS transporter, ACS family, pantothenate transporter